MNNSANNTTRGYITEGTNPLEITQKPVAQTPKKKNINYVSDWAVNTNPTKKPAQTTAFVNPVF